MSPASEPPGAAGTSERDAGSCVHLGRPVGGRRRDGLAVFPSIGALVTDTGGLLSHPAIIAREYGLPAVVATGNATALLHDDHVVTVDGSSAT
jgi:phosphohistidine swiveling domain-containing protein